MKCVIIPVLLPRNMVILWWGGGCYCGAYHCSCFPVIGVHEVVRSCLRSMIRIIVLIIATLWLGWDDCYKHSEILQDPFLFA